MKRKLLTLMLIMSVAIANVGCGSKDGSDTTTSTPVATEAPVTTETPDTTPETTETPATTEAPVEDNAAYADATAALNAIWDKFEEDYMFPCFGGSIETAVENAAGKIDLSDVNTMTSTLLIPEDLQASVTDAASLMHMMNANTFTGAAIKVEGMDAAAVAEQIKASFLGTHFMCGMPDKIEIASVGGYVVYAFGAEDIINYFFTKAAELENVSILVDAPFELDF